MRIKINDKIYRLKEIESGVDSLMELVEEPKFKDGDFLHSDWNDENITIICRKINGDCIYYHVSKSNGLELDFDRYRYWPNDVDFRLATEAEKQELLDVLAKAGKRWNEEKKCIENIPKRKFKKGDKVRIKHGVSSKTHHSISPYFPPEMDCLIGKTMTVDRYTIRDNYVVCNGSGWCFHEDWLEPYEELKEGDLAIFWDNNKRHAIIRVYKQFRMGAPFPHQDCMESRWKNAIKFESKEQFEKLIKGEI